MVTSVRWSAAHPIAQLSTPRLGTKWEQLDSTALFTALRFAGPVWRRGATAGRVCFCFSLSPAVRLGIVTVI